MTTRTWDEAREAALEAARMAMRRLGAPCEHYSGCTYASEYAIGSYFSDDAALDGDFEPDGWVACEFHVMLNRGDRCIPSHPRYPGGTL